MYNRRLLRFKYNWRKKLIAWFILRRNKMVEDWDNVEYRLSYEVPLYEMYELSPVNELCFKYLEFTEEMMQWCKDNDSYVSLSIISLISGILEDAVYKITFYTKEEYEEFCKLFKYEIREPYVNVHGCNEKGQVDVKKGDDKVNKQSEEQGSWWVAFCKSFDSLEDHTLGHIKLVLKDYKNPWEELSAERKDAVKCMIRDYWYAHNKELGNSVKEWLDCRVPMTGVDLSELLREQYCVETLCLGKEARDSLFHMTLMGAVYKDLVLKKFSDWFDTFDWYGPPTLEYSLQHISEVEGIDVAAISNEIKEEVRKMIDKKTREIDERGKVMQRRDSKGRFVSNKNSDERKIKLAPHVYADSLRGVYNQLLLMEEAVSTDIYDVVRVMLFIREASCLANDGEITRDELEALLKERFGYTCMCDILATSEDADGKTVIAVRIPHHWYFTGAKNELITITLNFSGKGTEPDYIEYPEPK